MLACKQFGTQGWLAVRVKSAEKIARKCVITSTIQLSLLQTIGSKGGSTSAAHPLSQDPCRG